MNLVRVKTLSIQYIDKIYEVYEFYTLDEKITQIIIHMPSSIVVPENNENWKAAKIQFIEIIVEVLTYKKIHPLILQKYET